jgi:hypothetical protein
MKFIFHFSRYVLVTTAVLGFGTLAATAQTPTPKPHPSKTPAGYKASHSSPSSGQQNSMTSHYDHTAKTALKDHKTPKGLKSTAASGSSGQDNSMTQQPKHKPVKPTTPAGMNSSAASGSSGQDNSMSSQPH